MPASRIAAVVRLELRTQQREPLTVLYMLVLGLLAAAFAAAGPVELVRGRGDVPRDSAWSLWLAATALTAFGQVITTMVAATVVLRDAADGVQELLIATRLTRREYLVGKLAAALLVLCVIYAAIPLGLMAGALLEGGTVSASLRGPVLPFVVLVLPTMLAIGSLQFAAGVLSGKLWVIVGQGLVLIWLWSLCADAATARDSGALAALLDPFGTAPILRVTATWTDAERALRPMPLTDVLIANRLLWLCIGVCAASFAVRHVPRMTRPRATTAAREVDRQVASAAVSLLVADGSLAIWQSAAAIARSTTRWMLRDTGWRVLALLGVVNVSVHAYLDAGAARTSSGAPHSADVGQLAAAALQTHSRLFLILLATIYAGELVWREREDRSAPLFDALPVRDAAIVIGQVLGVIAAQAVLIVMLGSAALSGAMIGARSSVALAPVLACAMRLVFAPFVLWMVLSLAVHAVVQQKVAAHLICIATWVIGVLTDQVAALSSTDAISLGRGLKWTCLGALVTWLAWVRGERGPIASRFRVARRRVGIP